MSFDKFLGLTMFETNCILIAYNESYKENLIAFEGLANIVGMTGFSRIKEPIVWVKRDKKQNVNNEQIKLLQEYNSVFLN